MGTLQADVECHPFGNGYPNRLWLRFRVMEETFQLKSNCVQLIIRCL